MTEGAAKVDPETLAIRGRPPRAIRFKRGVIIAIAAIGSVSLIAVTWMALRPHMVRPADNRQELTEPDPRAGTDALNGAPATYGDVPRLGPPLPGDLGKSILERQRQLDSEAGAAAYPNRQVDAAEHERQVSALRAARESGLLVQSHQTAPAAAPAEPVLPGAGLAPSAYKVALDPDRDPNSQQRKSDFLSKTDGAGDINPHAVVAAASPYMLSAGSVIAASLLTGLRSDLPGLVTAQVTEGVYDSATGHILLIPQGARLVGTYDSVIAFGQRRALVVWQRLIFPDGSSLRLDNAPATDSSGYAGLADRVDFHTWELLKGVVLSTMLGVGTQLQFSRAGDLVEALRQSTQQSVSQAGSQVTARNLQIQPTITIRPGAPVRLMVHHDLILKPWQENGRWQTSNSDACPTALRSN